jgi:hypothetical protein
VACLVSVDFLNLMFVVNSVVREQNNPYVITKTQFLVASNLRRNAYLIGVVTAASNLSPGYKLHGS